MSCSCIILPAQFGSESQHKEQSMEWQGVQKIPIVYSYPSILGWRTTAKLQGSYNSKWNCIFKIFFFLHCRHFPSSRSKAQRHAIILPRKKDSADLLKKNSLPQYFSNNLKDGSKMAIHFISSFIFVKLYKGELSVFFHVFFWNGFSTFQSSLQL